MFIHRISFITAALLALALGVAWSKTVILPLTIEYSSLKSIIEEKIYTAHGNKKVVLNEGDGCRTIVISNPDVGYEKGFVRLDTKVEIFYGATIANRCIAPVRWEGYYEIAQEVKATKTGWTLKFNPVKSRIYDINHNKTTIPNALYSLVRKYVHSYVSEFTLNLGPPVNDVKKVISSFFPENLKQRGKRLVDSFRPGEIYIEPEALNIQILAEVDDTYDKVREIPPLTEKQKKLFSKTWEAWDSLLVLLISALSEDILSAAERQTLLDVLLESRYAFIEGTENNTIERDFVREQFVVVWKEIAPIFKKHLKSGKLSADLKYLAFFTASDALAVLDRIGPMLGIEVSRAGLLQLSKLIDRDSLHPLLYSIGENVELKKTLGLEKDEAAPAETGDDMEMETIEPLSWMFSPFAVTSAWAKSKKTRKSKRSRKAKRLKRPKITMAKIRQWVVTRKNFNSYLRRMIAELRIAQNRTLARGRLKEKYHPLYRKIILPTAWQESCFRQFKVRRGKIKYIRSYNRTSVGVMQIHERVWRGMYDIFYLRWDVQYNIKAGTEILELYLRRYALKRIKPDNPLSDEVIARTVYAMYNGGPKQFYRFLKRHRTGKYYKSDKLFWQKYKLVENGSWNRVQACIF
ncbi:hypothetical protein MNBD_NITROSPINAE02-1021 [hydrothermal vent metagenome]|uniref:Transglycosylase SLT domain-containing protein n=1 Tax=hydrothermal vent metagenome TaxID=652676 RepID=A0A3B1CNA4_9ZZZZ